MTTATTDIKKSLDSGGLALGNFTPPSTPAASTTSTPGIQGNALMPNGAKPSATTTPAVITSKPATADLNNIKSNVSNITTGMNTQAANATTAASDKATADATAKKEADDKAQKDKELAIKADAVNGGASTTSNDSTKSQEQLNLEKTENDLITQGQNVKDTITNLINGTIPLNAGELAQVSGLKAQFQNLIDQQVMENRNSEGVANIRGYQTGSGEYDPTFQVRTMGSIITGGLNKVLDLNIKMAAAVATMVQGFQDKKISAIKDAWTMYQDVANARIKAIQTTIDATQKAFDNAEKLKKDKLDELVHSDTVSYQDKQQAIAKAQLSETERHNLATELIQQQASGTPGAGGIMPAVTLQGNGLPSSTQQATFLAGLPQELATLVKGIANYDINPSALPTRQYKGVGGLTQAQVIALVAQYDPTFSQSEYNVRQAYKKSLASNTAGSLGGAINSANKATNHLTAFVNNISNLGNTWSSKTNWFLQNTGGFLIPGERQTMGAAKTEALGVADELAKFFKGTGVTDIQSITDWKSKFGTTASPADVRGLVEGAVNLMAGQLETLSEQYTRTMGKPPADLLIGPSAKANLSSLKNQGYTVNIPGIYYTDKDAYMKNGGSVDALSKARQTLVDANDPYNPATPENILELAQVMNQ